MQVLFDGAVSLCMNCLCVEVKVNVDVMKDGLFIKLRNMYIDEKYLNIFNNKKHVYI